MAKIVKRTRLTVTLYVHCLPLSKVDCTRLFKTISVSNYTSWEAFGNIMD